MILYLRLSLHAHKSFFLANIYEELYMHIIDAQTFGGVGFLLIREIIVSLDRWYVTIYITKCQRSLSKLEYL